MNNSYRYHHDWRPVKGSILRDIQICQRCKNEVRYLLVYDGDGIGFPGIWTYKLKQYYAFKCPICPSFEEVTKEEAQYLINRG